MLGNEDTVYKCVTNEFWNCRNSNWDHLGAVPESKRKIHDLYCSPVWIRTMGNRSSEKGVPPRPVLAAPVHARPCLARGEGGLSSPDSSITDFLARLLLPWGAEWPQAAERHTLRLANAPFSDSLLPERSSKNLVSYVVYLSGEAGLTWMSGSLEICIFHFKWINWSSDDNFPSEISSIPSEDVPVCWLRPSGWPHSCMSPCKSSVNVQLLIFQALGAGLLQVLSWVPLPSPQGIVTRGPCPRWRPASEGSFGCTSSLPLENSFVYWREPVSRPFTCPSLLSS